MTRIGELLNSTQEAFSTGAAAAEILAQVRREKSNIDKVIDEHPVYKKHKTELKAEISKQQAELAKGKK